MADSRTPDAEPEKQHPPRTRTGEIMREATGVGRFLASLTSTQYQNFAMTAMTLFVCVLGAWIVYRWDVSIQADKNREDKVRESMVRESNAQAELTRQHCAQEMEKTRLREQALVKEVQAVLLAHVTDQRDKDRQHEVERDKEMVRTLMNIQNAWAAFAIKLADLERLLRGKPPKDQAVLWPWELTVP